MKMTDATIDISLKIEPVMKVECDVVDCKFNLFHKIQQPHCNLKHIELSRSGFCKQYDKKGGT